METVRLIIASAVITLGLAAAIILFKHLIQELPPVKERSVMEEIKRSKNPVLVCNGYLIKKFHIIEENSLVIWEDKDRAFNLANCKVIKEGK